MVCTIQYVHKCFGRKREWKKENNRRTSNAKILKRTINSCIQMLFCLLAIYHKCSFVFDCITKETIPTVAGCPKNGRIQRREKPNMNRNYSNDKNLNVIYIKFINIKRFVSFIRCTSGEWQCMHRTLKLYARINLSATKREKK